MTPSEMLLGRLIEERLTPGADLAEVDAKIRSFFEEEWAVVFTDMAGFSRHAAANGIVPFLCLVHELKRIARPVFESNGGFVLKVIADSFLVVFRRAPDALKAVIELQRALETYRAGKPFEQHIEVGAGIGFGKVLKIGDQDVFGVEVNYAAKLGEDEAGPWQVLLTDAARAAVLHSPGVTFEPYEHPHGFPAWRACYGVEP